MTGCVDEQFGQYILLDGQMQKIINLQSAGPEKDVFAKYVGHKVEVRGTMSSGRENDIHGGGHRPDRRHLRTGEVAQLPLKQAPGPQGLRIRLGEFGAPKEQLRRVVDPEQHDNRRAGGAIRRPEAGMREV